MFFTQLITTSNSEASMQQKSNNIVSKQEEKNLRLNLYKEFPLYRKG